MTYVVHPLSRASLISPNGEVGLGTIPVWSTLSKTEKIVAALAGAGLVAWLAFFHKQGARKNPSSPPRRTPGTKWTFHVQKKVGGKFRNVGAGGLDRQEALNKKRELRRKNGGVYRIWKTGLKPEGPSSAERYLQRYRVKENGGKRRRNAGALIYGGRFARMYGYDDGRRDDDDPPRKKGMRRRPRRQRARVAVRRRRVRRNPGQ